MSTRSMIAFNNGDEIYAIYCHWDGYPAHNGRILRDHYNDIEKVEELMDLGDISSLAEKIGEKHDFETTAHSDWCKAYGRDRGESGCESRTFSSFNEAMREYGAQYFYLFDGNEWKCFDTRGAEVAIPD